MGLLNTLRTGANNLQESLANHLAAVAEVLQVHRYVRPAVFSALTLMVACGETRTDNGNQQWQNQDADGIVVADSSEDAQDAPAPDQFPEADITNEVDVVAVPDTNDTYDVEADLDTNPLGKLGDPCLDVEWISLPDNTVVKLEDFLHPDLLTGDLTPLFVGREGILHHNGKFYLGCFATAPVCNWQTLINAGVCTGTATECFNKYTGTSDITNGCENSIQQEGYPATTAPFFSTEFDCFNVDDGGTVTFAGPCLIQDCDADTSLALEEQWGVDCNDSIACSVSFPAAEGKICYEAVNSICDGEGECTSQ